MPDNNTALPQPRFDIKECLPEEITPAQNGIVQREFLQRIYCGGWLYRDAARSWNAMVRAAASDNIFLSVNHHSYAYRNIIRQRKQFLNHFIRVAPLAKVPSSVLCVKFEDVLYRLRKDKAFIELPGESTYGYGLAVYIRNAREPSVKAWLEQNASSFGFEREYNSLPSRWVYIRSRQSIPERVLELERAPEPSYSAKQVAECSGAHWLNPPPDDWTCNGMITSQPFRTGALAVIDQGNGVGVSMKSLSTTFRQCAGFICTEPSDELVKLNRPILVTSNVNEAIEKLSELFSQSPSEASSAKPEFVVLEDEEPLPSDTPEAVIFRRKKKMARRLLTIDLADLSDLSKCPWYDEYLALLEIRLAEDALVQLGREYCAELRAWYDERRKVPERELAVLGMIQFIDPMELTVPFNQKSWAADMRRDVREIFLDHLTRLSYSDEDIARYYLARQKSWRHPKRKMRVAFLFDSNNKCDKLTPLYETMCERDDVEPFIVVLPVSSYHHGNKFYQYFVDKYSREKVLDACSLADLRKSEPDYVFFRNPYEGRRPFPSFNVNDVVKFAKCCFVSYGASLAHPFIDRLFDEYMDFHRNVYFCFASSDSAQEVAIKMVQKNYDDGYQHVESLGYPALDLNRTFEQNDQYPKRILWTPRWSYDARIGGSHFMEYKDEFLALSDRYGDKVKLAMRPHMNMYKTLRSTGLINKSAIAAYKQKVKDKSVTLYSTYTDLVANFSTADILIADYSTIIPVYFLTGRPIIYCEFPNADFLPDYREMLECMYIARSWEDVERYLDALVAGEDPLFERRQREVQRMREFHAGAADRIIDCLLEDFNNSLASE